jgi:hypothetical protein
MWYLFLIWTWCYCYAKIKVEHANFDIQFNKWISQNYQFAQEFILTCWNQKNVHISFIEKEIIIVHFYAKYNFLNIYIFNFIIIYVF